MNPHRIYVVEDSARFIAEFRDRLARLGYDVCGRTAQGAKALREIPKLRPDLVLMNVRLARRMNGVAIATRLRALIDVPVVFVSTVADLKLVDEAIASGSFAHLVRPCAEHELHATLQAALCKHRSEAPLRSEKERLEAAVQQRTAELMASERQLRDLFDGTSDLIQSVAPDGKILFSNRAWRETLGYDGADLDGLNIFEIIHPDGRDHCREIFDRLMRGENVGAVDVAFLSPDGRRIALEGNITVRHEDGRPVGTRGIFRDVTSRHAAAAAARRTLERTAAFQGALLELRDHTGETPAAFFRAATESLARALRVDEAGLWLFDDPRTHLVCHDRWLAGAGRHEEGLRVPAAECAAYFAAIGTEECVLVDDLATDPRISPFKPPHLDYSRIVSAIDLPIRVRGQLAGVLNCGHAGLVRHWEPDEGKFAVAVAGYAMLVLEQAERHRAESALRELNENLERLVAERTAALRSSEERYALALRGASDALWDWDLATGTVFYSPRWMEMLGLDPTRVANTFDEIKCRLHPDEAGVIDAALQRYVAGETNDLDLEHRIRFADGTYRWVEVRMHALRDAERRAIRLVGTWTDITDRKRAQTALEASEARLKEAQRIAHVGHWETDLAGGPMLWSEETARIFGLDPGGGPVSDQFFAALIHPDDRNEVLETIERAIARRDCFRVEYRIRRPDGTQRIVLDEGEIVFGPDGAPTGLRGIVQDVTERHETQRQLRESEALYRALVESSADAIFLLDTDARILTANQKAARLHGYAEADLVGRHISELDDPADPEAVPLAAERTARLLAGETLRFEIRHRHVDGHTFPLEVVTTPIQFGGRTCFLAAERDITVRKLAEIALRESEARFRAVFNQSPIPIVLTTVPDRQIAAINEAAVRVLGVSRAEVIDATTMAAKIWAEPAQRGRFLELLARDGHVVAFEAKIRRRNGGIGEFLLNSSHLKIGEGIYTLTSMIDVTERRLAQEALEASEARYRILVESSSDGIFLLDAAGRIVSANRAAAAMHGRTREELATLTLADVAAPEHAEMISDRLHRLATGERLVFEAEHRRSDGSTFPLEASATPLKIGTENCVLVSLRDITERKAAEASRRESEEKFRTLFDHSPVPIVLSSVPEGLIVDVNQAALRHFGYTREEAIGRTATDLALWTDPSAREHYVGQLEATGLVEDFEAVMRVQDGRDLNILHDSRIVTLGGRLHAINTIRDITQQRQAEQEMSRLALLAKQTDNSVVIADLDQRITWTNDGFARLTGYTFDEIKGRKLTDVFPPPDTDAAAAEALRAALVLGENASCDLINYHKSGEPYWMHLTIQAMRDAHGEITGFFSTAIDITDRKLTELALEFLATGVIHTFGPAYFRVVAAALARLAGTDHGFVCAFLPGDLTHFHAYGHWRTGPAFPAEPDKVRGVDDKACAALVARSVVLIADEAAQLHPRDPLLRDRGISGYAAVRLHDEEGQPIGFLGVMGRRRLGHPGRVESLLRMFAVRVASEMSRQQTEAKFRDLFEFSPDAVLISDQRMIISDVNLRAVDLFGYPRNAIVGQSVEMLLPVEHRSALLERLRAYLDDPQPHAMGTSAPGLFARDKSGRVFPVDISLSPLKTPRGLLIVAAVRDITAQVRADELAATTHHRTVVLARFGRELAETTTTKAAARLLLQIANELLGWESAEVLSYHAATDRFTTLASYVLVDGTPREVTFASGTMLEPTEISRRVMTDGAQLVTPNPAPATGDGSMAAETGVSEIQVPIRVAGRFTGLLSVRRSRPGAYDPGAVGQLQTLADYGAGALARIQALDQLRASEERLRLVWDSTTDGMRLSDSRRRIVAANSAFCRMFGRPGAQIIGTLLDDLYQEATAAEVRAAHESWFSRRELPAMREIEPVLRDGRQLALETVHAFVETGGPEPLLLSAYRDVSARRLADRERELMQTQLRQSQKMEAIGTLAGGIAHDFNNILSAIITHTDLLRIDLPPDVPGRENVDDIASAAERARRLVQQILTFSRQGETSRQPMLLGPVIEEVQRLLRATLPAMVKLHYHADGNCPPVSANSTQIHQVVMNLCTNAWQALPSSAGNIRLDLACCDLTAAQAALLPPLSAGRHVRLKVSDDGTGMDEVTLARVFDPFFTTKKPGEGTGLGLSMVHGIMQGHGGAIAVVSAPEQGTTFSLYFPVAAAESAAVPPPGPIRPVVQPPSARLLLVDDEQVVGGALKKLLTRRGFLVTHCTTPEEALALCRQQPAGFDLTISDQSMPGMSGLELAAAIHDLNPRMPIVIQSGHVDALLKKAVGSHGIRLILQKPVASQHLCDVAVRCLSETG
ncbi:MAG TPA: PAS domain S-box protein [Opitutus sp.]|nr:PAS domain S-box protein [Opitutus sp.]